MIGLYGILMAEKEHQTAKMQLTAVWKITILLGFECEVFASGFVIIRAQTNGHKIIQECNTQPLLGVQHTLYAFLNE